VHKNSSLIVAVADAPLLYGPRITTRQADKSRSPAGTDRHDAVTAASCIDCSDCAAPETTSDAALMLAGRLAGHSLQPLLLLLRLRCCW